MPLLKHQEDFLLAYHKEFVDCSIEIVVEIGGSPDIDFENSSLDSFGFGREDVFDDLMTFRMNVEVVDSQADSQDRVVPIVVIAECEMSFLDEIAMRHFVVDFEIEDQVEQG